MIPGPIQPSLPSVIAQEIGVHPEFAFCPPIGGEDGLICQLRVGPLAYLGRIAGR